MERYDKNSKLGTIKTREEGRNFWFRFEVIKDCSFLEKETHDNIKEGIRQLLTNCWGDFGLDFIERHIIKATWLLILRKDDEIIGVSAVSKKKMINRIIYYWEITAISREFQSKNLMKKINAILFRYIFIDNLIKNKSLTVEVMLITPNPKVLCFLSEVSNFIYPNPFLFNFVNIIKKNIADEETWIMAKKIISQSDKPNRIINRNGCVLNGSYTDMPWLIYKENNIPWCYNEIVNNFCRAYLDYEHKQGKEFIVRSKITPRSLFYYIFRFFRKKYQ